MYVAVWGSAPEAMLIDLQNHVKFNSFLRCLMIIQIQHATHRSTTTSFSASYEATVRASMEQTVCCVISMEQVCSVLILLDDAEKLMTIKAWSHAYV